MVTRLVAVAADLAIAGLFGVTFTKSTVFTVGIAFWLSG